MPANPGFVIVLPTPGRKYDQAKIAAWDADARGGDLRALLHRDLVGRAIYQACTICGHPEGSKRCDFAVKEKNGLCCDRIMCPACAVHIPTRNDCHYCPAHAKEAGIVLGVGGFHAVRL
jgi:hypothetical protein